MAFKVSFQEKVSYKPTFQEKSSFRMKFNTPSGGLANGDHDKLKNRDLADQHPISAITGLTDLLDEKLGKTEEIIFYCGDSVELVS